MSGPLEETARTWRDINPSCAMRKGSVLHFFLCLAYRKVLGCASSADVANSLKRCTNGKHREMATNLPECWQPDDEFHQSLLASSA